MPVVELPTYSTTAMGWRGAVAAELSAALDQFATVYPVMPPGGISTPCVIMDDASPVAELSAVGEWDRTIRLRCIGSIHDNAARQAELEVLVQALQEMDWYDEWLGADPQELVEIGDGAYPSIEVELLVYGQTVDETAATVASRFSVTAWANRIEIVEDAGTFQVFAMSAAPNRLVTETADPLAQLSTVTAAATADRAGAATVTGTSTVTATGTVVPPSGFDPIADIAWRSVLWTEGANMVGKGYGDGMAVADGWPSEVGVEEFENPTGTRQPTWRAAFANLNGKPAVESDGGDILINTTNLAVGNQPRSTFVVAFWPSRDNTSLVHYSQGNAQRILFGCQSNSPVHGGGSLQYHSGNLTIGEGTIGVTVQNSTSSYIGQLLDRALEGPANAGTNDFIDQPAIFGSRPGTRHVPNGTAIAFCGIYDGDLTADAKYADLVQWATDHYALT